jgi:hypothetical protein
VLPQIRDVDEDGRKEGQHEAGHCLAVHDDTLPEPAAAGCGDLVEAHRPLDAARDAPICGADSRRYRNPLREGCIRRLPRNADLPRAVDVVPYEEEDESPFIGLLQVEAA